MESNLSCLYSDVTQHPSPDVFQPARAAFMEALEDLRQRFTENPKKRCRLESLQATNMSDVLDAVAEAQQRYESEHTKSKARKCVTELSKRICHYGKIMDVMVQQHPEYVSLAWGTMKLVFGAIVEHESLGRAIVKGLCDIADALPRAETNLYLYPTNAGKQAVALLYGHIMKFLLRALDWYEKGKIARAIHSITKPVPLQYGDLMEDIKTANRNISDHALASSHAEQRDMHHELQNLTTLVKNLQEQILLDQAVKSSALLECRHALSDLQLTQALSIVSSSCRLDHKTTFQASLTIRNKHRHRSKAFKCAPFWTSSELREWSQSHESYQINLCANYKSRLQIRDFGTNVIEQLLRDRITVLWVLKPPQTSDSHYSVIQILNSLILQALSLDFSSHTGTRINFQLHKFLNAHSESDYVNVLASILVQFKLVYIIIEAGAMTPADSSQCQNNLHILLKTLAERDNSRTVIKAMTLSYGPNSTSSPFQPMAEKKSVLKVHRAVHRKGKFMPLNPLQNLADCYDTRRQNRMPLRARRPHPVQEMAESNI